MNRITTPQSFQRSGLRFLCTFSLLLLALSVFGQGWVLSLYTAGGGASPAKNDIPHLPAFMGDQLLVSGYSSYSDHENFQFFAARDEGFQGMNTSLNPFGTSSTTSHTPTANLMVGGDTLFFLTEVVETESDRADAYLGRYYYTTEGSGWVRKDWYRPLLTNELQDIRTTAMAHTLDGQIIVTGTSTTFGTNGEAVQNIFLAKVATDATVLWSTELPFPGEEEEAVQVVPAPDGGYWLLQNTPTEPWLLKTDALGNLEWEMALDQTQGDHARDMILTADGNLMLTGQTVGGELYVLKMDDEGTPIWRQTYSGTAYTSTKGNGLIEDLEGRILVAGEATLAANGEREGFLAKLLPDGTPLWERNYGKAEVTDEFNDITRTPSGQYLMAGYRQFGVGGESTLAYFVKTDTLGIVKGGLVKGNVFHDLDEDCTDTGGDTPLDGWIVQAANDSLNFFGQTDEFGNYSIPVFVTNGNPVDYLVSVVTPSEYWEPCANEVPLTVIYQDTLSVDFAIQSLVDCPLMEVQISSSTHFRLCDTTVLYFNYCNHGTQLAEDASLTVRLPDELTFVSASLPPTGMTDTSYAFDLGDVGINECGLLSITAAIACDEILLGNVACVSASILPDTICPIPDSNWSGALLHAGYSCDDGNIQFQIENVGTASTTNVLDYVIIEDAVLLLDGSFDLDPDQVYLPDAVPQTGATYTLIAQQEPGAPGAALISVGAGACSEDGGNTVHQFDQYDGDPFSDIYCLGIIGSYDPNDKQALPAGFGEEHGILANTDLQYTIRFQNTGTDTAFRVIIRDTIADELDLSTFRPVAGSHPYSWRFEERALVFNFHGIELPDSTTNPRASQGFVSFNIAQQANLPAETRIENRAGIYFDFNSPIITNTTFHTVKDWIDVVNSSVEVSEPELTVTVAPNPMQDGAWIRLEGKDMNANQTHLQLFDMTGRLLRELVSHDGAFWLPRGQLPSGMYLFRIDETNGQHLANGKLVIQ